MPFCGGARCIDWGGHDNVPCQVMCIIMVSDHLFWHMSGSSVCCTCADYPVALYVFCSSATLCLVRSSWALVLLRGCLSPSGVSLRALCVLSTECYVQCVACRVRYGMRFFLRPGSLLHVGGVGRRCLGLGPWRRADLSFTSDSCGAWCMWLRSIWRA